MHTKNMLLKYIFLHYYKIHGTSSILGLKLLTMNISSPITDIYLLHNKINFTGDTLDTFKYDRGSGEVKCRKFIRINQTRLTPSII